MKTVKISILAGVLVNKFAIKREALAWKHQLSIYPLSLILYLPKNPINHGWRDVSVQNIINERTLGRHHIVLMHKPRLEPSGY